MTDDNPVALIKMKNGAEIKVELNSSAAPNTVKNFIALAKDGFYDSLLFHRAIPEFMIQGGCPEGLGTDGPGYRIKGEFSANGFDNKLEHERGVISMARAQDKDSAGSQFFLTVKKAGHLDGQYASFGKVLEGMEEVDRIANVPCDPRDRPLEKEIIDSITVDTFGKTYEMPEKS